MFVCISKFIIESYFFSINRFRSNNQIERERKANMSTRFDELLARSQKLTTLLGVDTDPAAQLHRGVRFYYLLSIIYKS